jgi:lysozyme
MLEGIDVYHEGGEIDWAAVQADGISFAIPKATQGTKFTDPRFASNWSGAAEAGITIRGAYHFLSLKSNPLGQAEHFSVTVEQDLAPGDFFALDVEKNEGKTGAQVHDAARVWVDEIQRRFTDHRVVIYSGHFWREIVRSSDNLGCELWLPAYVKPDDHWVPGRYVPQAWIEALIWQYTSSGSVGGIKGRVDRNRCRLTEDEFTRWLNFESDDPHADLPVTDPRLAKGSRGIAVRRLQEALESLGFDARGADGKFGANTENAVRDFQSSRDLDVDGIVGADVWAALHAES